MRPNCRQSRALRSAVLVVATLALLQSSACSPLGLSNDDEMIAHFKAHRSEFDALVMMYQKHGQIVSSQPEYREHAELSKRTGVRQLTADGEVWLPDPYSMETVEKAKNIDPFHAYAHHGLMLRSGALIPSLRVKALVWKFYFYVPVVPRVEQGRLWWPRSHNTGQLHRSAPVFDSLDDYPSDWVQGQPVAECVFRPIEPQWFLEMCASRAS